MMSVCLRVMMLELPALPSPSRVTFEPVERLEAIVASGSRRFDTHTAQALGFPASDSFETAMRTFIAENVT